MGIPFRQAVQVNFESCSCATCAAVCGSGPCASAWVQDSAGPRDNAGSRGSAGHVTMLSHVTVLGYVAISGRVTDAVPLAAFRVNINRGCAQFKFSFLWLVILFSFQFDFWKKQ